MKIKTGRHDTLIIVIIAVIVVCFYLFLYFQVDKLTPTNGGSTPPPQPIGISPVTQRVNVGDLVTIEVVNSQATDLFGFGFDMNYDPEILEFVSIAEGNLLKLDGQTSFCIGHKIDNPGLIKNVACTRLGRVGGVTGSGVMATVTFTAKSSGTSAIELTNMKLSDMEVNILTPETSGGEIVVG